MSNILQKSPFAGFVIAALFGAFGLLILRVAGNDAKGEIVLWMYRMVGFFLLFVAFLVFTAAAGTLIRIKKERNPRR